MDIANFNMAFYILFHQVQPKHDTSEHWFDALNAMCQAQLNVSFNYRMQAGS